eukprot:scaffold12578_cov30-Tisochrysis_lutea.AAC.11
MVKVYGKPLAKARRVVVLRRGCIAPHLEHLRTLQRRLGCTDITRRRQLSKTCDHQLARLCLACTALARDKYGLGRASPCERSVRAARKPVDMRRKLVCLLLVKRGEVREEATEVTEPLVWVDRYEDRSDCGVDQVGCESQPQVVEHSRQADVGQADQVIDGALRIARERRKLAQTLEAHGELPRRGRAVGPPEFQPHTLGAAAELSRRHVSVSVVDGQPDACGCEGHGGVPWATVGDGGRRWATVGDGGEWWVESK